MKISRFASIILGCLALCYMVRASSVIPLSMADKVRVADAIFRGTVVGQSCFQDTNGLIFTRTSLQVDESLKGTFPATVQVIHRGGVVGNRDEFAGYSPRFKNGASYLVFVTRRANGTLECLQGTPGAILLQPQIASKSGVSFNSGDQQLLSEVRALTDNGSLPGADVTDQSGSSGAQENAVTGLLADTNSISSRFIQPDRGDPIPYLIDADTLPVGITLNQATNAVVQALNAWTAVTSLKFKFEGFKSFGQGADTITIDDQKLRIQLHDNYNSINQSNVLGIGGRSAEFSILPNTTWDIGGNVAGNEFHRTAYGYVVLESTNAALSNPSTLAEVLCHEVGHALSMAHSSETNTTNPLLFNSIMYFQAHADGRGATLGAYDPPVIDQAYPTNTPPFGFNRFMDVVDSGATQPNVPGINEIDFRGYDLQTTNLTLIITNLTAMNGTFSQAGTKIKYAPFPGIFADAPRFDPADNSAYDALFGRFSDGTNASPYVFLGVVSFSSDSFPSPSDGIPDNWMTQYFGNANPATGTNHKATNDFDHDGLSNFQEYLIGSNPTNASSGLLATATRTNTVTWQARPYDLYEIVGTTNLLNNPSTNWVRVGNPVEPTNSTGIFNIPASAASLQFFRVLRVP
ncbi:MAG TPA: matrixin family metalloprotease [Verrucomicrobiae bacterium]|nr:matrixin family metalloprotease [Verrucomicrobiae bacterium]